MPSREEARLRELFRRLVLVSLATSAGATASVACSSSSGSTSSDGDDASTHDATASDGSADAIANDANDASTRDSANDASADTSADSAPVSCDPGPVTPFDAGGDAGPGCAYAIDFPCGLPSFVTMLYPPACYLSIHDCSMICTGVAANPKDCRVAEGYGCDAVGSFNAPDGGPIKIECAMCLGVGRRPAGLATARVRAARSAMGDFFARVAHLEAASVNAFVALGHELDGHRAPRALVRMAERCARDERRHARVTSRIARRFGGEVPAVRVARVRTRSLVAMAIENAVEGCVRETFGALVATWQAENARDAEVASAMTAIARDETRHAAMAWAVARWLEPQLDARARARVARAKRDAIAELRRECAAHVDATLVRDAGVPTSTRASELLETIHGALWAAHVS
jgi:hypothetical protein